MNDIFLSDDMLSMLSSIFPELSDKQLKTSVMFASGVSLEDMACSWQVSVTAIRKLLHRSMEALSVFSLACLRTVVQTRLSIFSLQNQLRMCSMMESL